MNSAPNPAWVEAALAPAQTFRPFPPAADRAAWTAVRAALPPPEVDAWLARAAAAESDPQRALAALVIAACLDGDERFAAALDNPIAALCAALAARDLDAETAHTALTLAETICLMGDTLPPALVAQVRAAVDSRIFAPFLARHDFAWWRQGGHAAAACAAHIVSAALYLENDPARLAEIVARGLWCVWGYPQPLVAAGWCDGLAAWALMGHLLAARSAGALDPLADAAGLARLPRLTRLGPGLYAGCDTAGPPAALLSWLAQRFDQPELAGLAAEQRAAAHDETLPWALRGLLWRASAPLALPTCEWDADLGWLAARFAPHDPHALALVLMGSQGAALSLNGERLLSGLPAPLAGGYTPLPGGQVVPMERQSNAHFDMVGLELKDAYPPEAALMSLRRVVAFHRNTPRGWVELVDGVMFDGAAHALEMRLVTPGKMALATGVAVIDGQRATLRVEYDPEQVAARIEPGAVVFAFAQPRRSGAIRLKIEPVL